jgi:hypothetical protein
MTKHHKKSHSMNASAIILAATTSIFGLSAGTAIAQETAPDFMIGNVSAAQNQDAFAIEARAESLVVDPVLSAGLIDSVRTVVRGKDAQFLGYSNYPVKTARSEIRIFEAGRSADATPLAVVAANADGLAGWQVPSDAPEALAYVYRVYDANGQFDETKAYELTVVNTALDSKAGVNRPEFGAVDQAATRNIPASGVAITVTGRAQANDVVRVSGQLVPVDNQGQWVARQIVDRTAASVVVTIIRDGITVAHTTRSFSQTGSKWFVVGQGDLTAAKSFGSGPSRAATGNTQGDGDFVTGRAAFYAKGLIGGDIQVTASLDTGEALVSDLFSNLDRKDPRQLFRRLDSDQYYPTYGDDSTLIEDAPTQGRFYLRVQKDDSRFVLGNFSTAIQGAELAQLDRGLFGALVDHKSGAATSFGERKTQVTAFASDPGTVPGRDEFRGTGGSIYFLKRQDVSVGSERVRIEVRDRETGLVLESRELHPQQDYDFDPFQGRISLVRPLASTVATNETVRNGVTLGNVPVLVIRYEYSPAVGALDGYTLGGRGTQWLGDKLRVGLTAQSDTVEDADQTLLGADILLRQTAGTYLKAEVAQTDGPGYGQSNSVDGGLNFTDFSAANARGGKSAAWRAEGAVNFAELAGKAGDHGTVNAFYEKFDAGFGSVGRLTGSATQRWGVGGNVPLGRSLHVAAKFNELRTDLAGASRTGTVDVDQRFGGGVTGKIGLRYEDRVPGQLYNSVQQGARVDVAAQLGYQATSGNWSVYGFGQATLDRDATRSANNRGGVGVKAELTERLSLNGEMSEGTGGIGADVQLNHRLGDGSEAYIGYALSADRTDTALETQNLFTRSNQGTLTVGARKRFSDSLTLNGEQRLAHGGQAPSLVRSFGLKFEPTAQLSITGNFENGRIDDATTGLFKRTAAGVAVGFTSDSIRIGSGVELRVDNGNSRDQTVWLVRNNVEYKANADWRFTGRLNFAVAEETQANVRAADFIEGVAGFAYRPVRNERLNALVRFTYLQDLGPIGQISGGGTVENPKQKSMIGVVDFNYDLSAKLTVGAKYGYRKGSVSLGRASDTFVSSDAHLAVIRADYRVVKNWDVLGEVRYLSTPLAGSKNLGALGAIYRHLGNNVKLGVGYSLSDFSADLTDQSYSSHGPFINLLGKF